MNTEMDEGARHSSTPLPKSKALLHRSEAKSRN
jgi:hypothetical protein